MEKKDKRLKAYFAKQLQERSEKEKQKREDEAKKDEEYKKQLEEYRLYKKKLVCTYPLVEPALITSSQAETQVAVEELDIDEEFLSDEEETVKNEFYCAVCKKKFNSTKQYVKSDHKTLQCSTGIITFI